MPVVYSLEFICQKKKKKSMINFLKQLTKLKSLKPTIEEKIQNLVAKVHYFNTSGVPL